MLYKFKSKAGADVIMLSPQGDQILSLIGRAPAASGILQKNQLGAAISALEMAVADDEAAFAKLQADAHAADEPVPRREGISLRQRAWPLVELMKHALKAGDDITWGA